MSLAALPGKKGDFVLAVLRNPTNYTEAARVAGYKFPNVESVRLVNDPQVAACIALGEQIREDRTFVTSDRTLHEFAIIAFSDITNFEVYGKGQVRVKQGVPAYAVRAISSIKWKVHEWEDEKGFHTQTETDIKLWNKNDALKMLAMYQKLLSGEGGVNLTVDNSKHVHMHQHNSWKVGDNMLTF